MLNTLSVILCLALALAAVNALIRRNWLRIDERTFFLAGVMHSLVALWFGLHQPVQMPGGEGGCVPNTVAAGFSVAGGLCVLAAAVIHRHDDRDRAAVPPSGGQATNETAPQA